MLHIARLRERKDIPRVPVYLNSPMAINATRQYHAHHSEHHVSEEDCQRMFDVATFVNTVEESKALNRQRGERKSVVSGKSVSVREDLGGRRIIKKKRNSK